MLKWFQWSCFAALLKPHFVIDVLLSICCMFLEHLFLRTLLEDCFWCDHDLDDSGSSTAWKVSKYGVISGPHFPVFGLKYRLEITPYLDNFHAVPLKTINVRTRWCNRKRCRYGGRRRTSTYCFTENSRNQQKFWVKIITIVFQTQGNISFVYQNATAKTVKTVKNEWTMVHI